MKKHLLLASTLMITFSQAAFCVSETVSPELEQSLKTHSHEPGFFSVVLALIVVISLIYVTGLIYSKLNIVGAKTVQEQLINHDMNKAIVISTTQLGQNKNLHVIELNKKRYLIGAAQESITMLKELGEVEAKESIKKLEKETIEAETESFDVHKKYL